MPPSIVSTPRYSWRSARHHDAKSSRTLLARDSTASMPPGSNSLRAGRSKASKPPPRDNSPQSTAMAAALALISFPAGSDGVSAAVSLANGNLKVELKAVVAGVQSSSFRLHHHRQIIMAGSLASLILGLLF